MCLQPLCNTTRKSNIEFCFNLLQNVSGRGQFQVRLIKIQNIDGVKSGGSCCDGTRSEIHGSNRCKPDNCDTFFRICLQHYQEKVQENGGCTLGNATTPVLGKDSFLIADTLNTTSPPFRNPVSMHFEFLWLVGAFYSFHFNTYLQFHLLFNEFHALFVK